MSLKHAKEQIAKISADLDNIINEYEKVRDTISKRGKKIQHLIEGHSLEPEIGQKLQSVQTSIENSKLLVRTQTAKLEKYKMDNLGGY